MYSYISSHKIIAGIALVVVVGGGWWVYAKATGTTGETRYVLGNVSKTTLIGSITGSGQVSVAEQVDVKSKVSGDVTWVGVKAGDIVKSGQSLIQIDSTDARQAVIDAEQSLAQAKLEFQKDTAQAPIDYEKSEESLAEAKKELITIYNDTFNTLSNTYLDLPAVVTGMHNILYSYDLSPTKTQWNVDILKNFFTETSQVTTVNTFATTAMSDYSAARSKYDQNLINNKKITRYSKAEELEKLLADSVDGTTAIAQAVQSELNLLDTVVDYSTQNNRSISAGISTMQSNAKTYLSTANSKISTLLAQQKAIDAAKKTIRDNERTLQILKIGNPTGEKPISLQATEYSLADQERNLQKLKNDLADYTVRAQFDGKISALTAKRLAAVSSGTSVATLITNTKIAELSLNEVDAAKIDVGDKATITLDAIEDLSLTGSVIEMDAVGTVSQGVVSYKLKIGFDSEDDRVKPGMTVNASIITDVHADVLAVPATAVKTRNGATYVLMFDPALSGSDATSAAQGVTSTVEPKQVAVEVGISNDTMTEIVSGLTEGQQIVVRSITASVAQTSTQNAPSLFGGGGATRATTGTVRSTGGTMILR